ncbi:FG-GAP-like repeat-containing protein [Oligoflexus tunisiensis]|uniref:FG-GAP-like repeat-containing protein n=1 Tax=Oligoflexus tunisiensis TaxID=708132 RepID=UPI00114D162E|nr:FG-GAP-like repeat-containing protein [Oligoflexus tunisiensis]
MSLLIHFTLAALTLASVFSAGCNKHASTSTKGQDRTCSSPSSRDDRLQLIEEAPTDDDAARAGALAVGNAMIDDLCDEITTVYNGELAEVIADGASEEMAATVGSLIITVENGLFARSRFSFPLVRKSFLSLDDPLADFSAVQVVASPIIRGALLRLTDSRASLRAPRMKVAMAQRIMSGTSASLQGRTSDLTTDETLQLMGAMTNTAVASLPAVDLAGENSQVSVAAVTRSAVGALPRAGIETTAISQGAQKLTEGAVAALSGPGFDPASLGTLTGEVAGSAIQGLGAAGLSADTIMQGGAIELIISGATSGLKKSEADATQSVGAMGFIAGAAVSALGTVGIRTPEMKKSALAVVIQSSMSGAQSLATNGNASLAGAMTAVANKAVMALTRGGFQADQIGDAVSVIVETGVSEISKAGITNASIATEIAAGLIEGALSGAGSLIQSGTLDAEKGTEAALKASDGAVKGLESLQTAGIVTGDAVSVFTNSIAQSVSSGLEKGGANSEIVANAQSSVNTRLESDEVQGTIQSNAGTAQAVATPTISVASGTYTAAFSVTLSTTLTGATIRYTLDGSTPTSSSGTIYTAAIPISATKTIKAIAYKTGWANSAVASAVYTVNIATFASPVGFSTGTNPEGIAAGDLNGDGKVDLAVALHTGQGVSHLLGNGDGTFGAKQDVSCSPNSDGTVTNINAAMIDVGDLNGDNTPDVAWGAWGNNYLSYLTNTTSAHASTLTFANNIPTGHNAGISGPRGVVITDVDANGMNDIAIGEANGNTLIFYMNQSGSPGTFVKFGTAFIFNPDSTVYNGNTHPWMIAVGDFNHDSKPDVAGGGGFGGIMSVLLNNTTVTATPAFQTANRINTNTALGCTNNSNLSLSDLNGDGKVDIVATCPTSGQDKVAVFLNTTTTSATAASFTVSSFDAAEGIAAVASGDVDGDSVSDVVAIADGSPNTLSFYRGHGDGTFATAETFSIGTGTGPSKVILVDVNGDSRLDAVVSHGTTNQVSILLNQTTGS